MSNLKNISAFVVSLLCFGLAYGQSCFTIKDTLITLTKTTDFGTVHWYANIQNEIGVDTTLMWKAEFSTDFPTEWEINFDDQNQNYVPVQHNDSATFVLYGQSFPQKLIIGNDHQGKAGYGIATFYVYPIGRFDLSQKTQFEFTINPGSTSIKTMQVGSYIHVKYEADYLVIEGLENGDVINKIGLTGQLIGANTIVNSKTATQIAKTEEPQVITVYRQNKPVFYHKTGF